MDNQQLRHIIKEIQQKEGVGLAEIAAQSGLDRSYLSSFIHAKVRKSVTEKMMGKLTKGFPGYFVAKQQNTTTPNGQQKTTDPLTGAHVTLQDHINLLKDYNEKLFVLLSSSLENLQEGQRIMIAYQKAWVDHAAELESEGDTDKKEEIKYKFGKLVDDILSSSSLSGIQSGSGKQRKV